MGKIRVTVEGLESEPKVIDLEPYNFCLVVASWTDVEEAISANLQRRNGAMPLHRANELANQATYAIAQLALASGLPREEA